MREATIHVSDDIFESFGIGEFLSVMRDAGLDRMTELQCRRPGCLLVVEVADSIQSERLSSLDNIKWWERIDGGGTNTYLCKLTVPALEDEVDPHHETDISEGDIGVTDEGMDLRIVGSQDDISDRVAEYEQSGSEVLLRSIGDYQGPEGPLDALTARQREVLATAFELGYFVVPGEVTTEDVAVELDLSPSTVREHLTRAQYNVLAALFDAR